MKKQVYDPGGPVSPAARKKQKAVPIPEEQDKKKTQKRGRPYVESGKKDNCATRWW